MDHRNERPEEDFITENTDTIEPPVQSPSYLEETSLELTDDDELIDEQQNHNMYMVYGWIAIALSIISFFFIPVLFAVAGIVLGFISRNQSTTKVLGYVAIIIGVVSLISRLFMFPFVG